MAERGADGCAAECHGRAPMTIWLSLQFGAYPAALHLWTGAPYTFDWWMRVRPVAQVTLGW